MRHRSFVDLLRRRAEERPEAPLYGWLRDGEEMAGELTRAGLDRRARALAAALGERLRPGDRALLLHPPGLELVASFFGCLYAGVIAVPAYPPRGARTLPRLRTILADARPAAVLTEESLLGRLEALAAAEPAPAAPWLVATDRIDDGPAGDWRAPGVGPDTVAFLQYTSGSTSDPKGVVVSHGNLLANEEAIRRAFRQTEDSVVVSWLPPYHDMGLIGGILQPLYSGGRSVLMAPGAFLQRPARWLRAISEHRATTSGGPDFAYALCADKAREEELDGLDLSSWEVAFDGSEPVRPATLERFARTFGPHGFRPAAFYPCYGLAEATLFVTGGEVSDEPVVLSLAGDELERHRAVRAEGEGTRAVTGCGHSRPGHSVTVVDPETGRRLRPGRVGEIWVRGPSVARGYWGRPEATERVFGARRADAGGGARGAGPYLRTGDLGFLDGGELFVTGRLKDLVILRGRNHYPSDLEATAESAHEALRPGGSAAFSVERGGEERLVLACELERRFLRRTAVATAVVEAVRAAVVSAHDAPVSDVVLLPPGGVPRTSSGKVRRGACRRAYLEGRLDRRGAPASKPEPSRDRETLDRAALLALEAPERRGRLEGLLRPRVAALLELDPEEVPAGRPLIALGLDSLRAAELAHGLERDLGVEVGQDELLDGESLEALSSRVSAAIEGGSAPRAPRRPAPDPPAEFPATAGQRALWFLHGLGRQPRAYGIAVGLRAAGSLDAAALRRSFEALVARHPALRSTFHDTPAGVVQRVHAEARLDFDETDVRGWEPEAVDARLRDAARRPFDLEAGPLLRVAVLRHGEDDRSLVVAVHHVVSDFWSLGVLFEELQRRYALETGGPAAAPEPAPVHPSDVARWRRELLAGPEGDRQWAYWRDELAGAPAQLDLPTDHPRPPVQSDHGAAEDLDLAPDAAAALRRLARDSGVTLFGILLAGLGVLLHRLSGQPDVVVGTPASGRRDPALAGVVGYLVNPLPLRVRLGGNPEARELLGRVRRTVLGAFAHQDLPFPVLTERLRPVRDPGRSPLFQVLLGFQAARRPDLAPLAGLAVGDPEARVTLGSAVLRPIPLGEPPAQLDLSLAVAETAAGGLRASLVYNTDLFDSTTARRTLRRLEIVLDALARAPELRVADLPLLSATERHQLLHEWNDTASRPAGEAVRLFPWLAGRATAWPDRVAVVAGGRALSYGGLMERARALAVRLRAAGAAPEVPVGIFLDRSTALVEALLGVLASGAAYLPLDPEYPAARVAAALADAHVPVVVTTSRLAPGLQGYDGRRLALDDPPEPATPLALEEPPSDLGCAYVIYTSGSTGRPKGVQVLHRGVVGFLRSIAERPGIRPDDTLVSVTTPAFDIAVLELFSPLLAGARVAVAERSTAADGEALRRLLELERATVMQATPATWRLLVDAGWRAGPGFRALSGGEALPPELAAELVERAGEAWNLYGPTETTIWSTVERLEPGTRVSIGRPIRDTVLRVLGTSSRPAPTGAPGELAIGGRGLARGYLRRPATTAERFVPDPAAGAAGPPGARLYRTGDLVRRRPDGRVDYLGRLDHQVKLRGHRIELGEIEAVLGGHPAVSRAVAVVREIGPDDHRLVAYAVPAAGSRPSAAELRGHLRERLPEAFVPAAFVLLDELPLTANGKVDRRALPAPEGLRAEIGGEAPVAPRSELEALVAGVWSTVLGIDSVGAHDNFFDLGGHSLLLPRVRTLLGDALGRAPGMVDLFRHPTVATLAAHLAAASGTGERPSGAPRRRPGRDPGARAVAVIGVAGRFPGARDVDELWRRLRSGEECVTFFSRRELESAGVPAELLGHPRYVPASAVLDGADLFDAEFFGFTPREAELMDPQHRVFLETSWAALEDAGYAPGHADGRVGVFAGVGLNTYLLQSGLAADVSMAARYQAFVGNDKDFVPTRVSYKLDLRGPSINVQTACSSSLVAVHLACRSLLDGECEMALAGGVTIRVPQGEGYLYEEGGIPSPDGHCRPFDAGAGGTVFGSGAGVVVLKPLDRALEEGDAVRAVILGSAVNNDGAAKIGYTAPGVEGQAEVVAEALAAAGVDPATVSYVEAHGTGTRLGDPIEVAALAEAFRRAGGGRTPRRSPCALGSIKGNVGHLDTAAGVAGLIKTIRALEARELPPSLHFDEPNPEIDFAAGPFRVNAALAPWKRGDTPRRAGVSSFGIGGTNAHVVLEEAPPAPPGAAGRPWRLLLLSARSASALEAASRDLAARLREAPELDLADVAFTLQTGRRRFAHRRALVCLEAAEAAAALDPADPELVADRVDEGDRRPVVFLFSGQGAQYPGMAGGLYDAEPAFRRHVDACAEHLRPLLGTDLRRVLFATGEGGAEVLERTEMAQPALFTVEYALARLWMEWGVRPWAMLGHSVGEYVAACLAGVFSLEDALRLVAVRGRLMQSMPPGAMVSVELGGEDLERFLGPGLDLAALNGPRAAVVSGPFAAVAGLEEALEAEGVRYRRLHTSHAFHSALMEPAVPGLVEEVRRLRPRAPRERYVSNLTGTWVTPAQATDPEAWGRHLRETVRFAQGLACLLEEPEAVFLEVGPGNSLCALVRRAAPKRAAVASLRHPRDPGPDPAFALRALGRLWLAGADVDWSGFHAGARRRRVPLPTYPFERRRFWLQATPEGAATVSTPGMDTTEEGRPASGWLYAPTWRPAPPAPEPRGLEGTWLLVDDGGDLAKALAERLGALGARVVRAVPAEVRAEEGVHRLDPARAEDYLELVAALRAEGAPPGRVIHAWNLASRGTGDAARTFAFDSLMLLARALGGAAGAGRPLRIDVLSDRLHRVGQDPPPRPERSLLLGPALVIPTEYPGLDCRSLDLPETAGLGTGDLERIVDDLVAELAAPGGDPVAALRGGRRWVRAFEPLAPGPELGEEVLRPGGHFLITGGLGGLGLTLAEDLASRAGARLTLVGRTPAPPRERWAEAAEGGEGVERELARRLLAIEAAGGEVLAVAADVADGGAMGEALRSGEARFGPVHGVIHAAGVAGGSLLHLESPEEVARVLRPKVEGTRVLASLLAGRELDLFALFSSVNGVAGGFGQADYAAANAFLDAFSEAAFARRGTRTVAIGWGPWARVGMAARAGSAAGSAADHPLLGTVLVETSERAVFRAELRPDRHWVLSEHRVAGRPTLPGTTYLEMARAAFERWARAPTVEIRDAVFPEPLVVAEGRTAEVLTVLERTPGGAAFRVVSPAPSGGWRRHAGGRLAACEAPRPAPRSLAELRAECASRVLDADADGRAVTAGDLLTTGPRWRSLRRLHVGRDRVLAEIELPGELAGDLADHRLHPALLDLATGAIRLVARGDYLPLTYRRLTLWSPLPARSFAHAVLSAPLEGSPELLTCDVTLLDEEGAVRAEVGGFTMRRVDAPSLARLATAAGEETEVGSVASPGLATIPPEDGVAAFHRILAGPRLPHVVVSPRPVAAVVEAIRAYDRDAIAGRLAELGAGLDGESGGAKEGDAAALPEDELERRIAEGWRRVLGVEDVGRHDNFFELGGTSLSAIQLVSELSGALGTELPTVSIFEAPTVAALARALRPSGGDGGSTVQRARARADRKARALAAGPRPARRRTG